MSVPDPLSCHDGRFASWRRTFTSAGVAVDVVPGKPISKTLREPPGSRDDLGGPGILEGELFDMFKSEPRPPTAAGDWYERGLMLTNLVKDGASMSLLYGVRVNEPGAVGIAVFAALVKQEHDRD